MEERLKQKRRIIILGATFLALCLAALLFLIWYGDGREEEKQQEPIVLTLVYAYQNAQWHQGIQTIVDEFNRKQGEIVINTQVQYEDKVYEDILAKLQARNQMGDIIQLKVPKRYAQEGLLVPIEESIGNMMEDPYYYEEEIYGVEALGSTSGILYNKDIFEQYQLAEPRTYDEFLKICDQLKQQGITPVGVAGGELWHMEFWVNHFFRTEIIAQEDEWLVQRQEGNVSWQDEAPVRMLSKLQQLFSSGYVNEDWLTKQDGNLAYSMSQGEVAMIYTGSWTARELQKLNPQMQLGWFYLPNEEGETIIPQNQDVYWSLTKSCGEDEAKYEAALRFLEFFYDGAAYGSLCEDTYGFPVTIEKAEYEENEIQTEIKQKFCTSQLHVTEYVGNENTPQGFEKELLYIVQDLATGKTDVTAAAQQLDKLWNYYQEQEK